MTNPNAGQAGEAWPNALAVAADLVAERGFSPRKLEDGDGGALAADRAVQIALGYSWQELDSAEDDDEGAMAFVAPDKNTAKLFKRLMAELTEYLVTTTDKKIPSVGYWNTTVTEPEKAVLALRIAAAQFEAKRAMVARRRAQARK